MKCTIENKIKKKNILIDNYKNDFFRDKCTYERYRKSCILVADSAWNKGLSDPAEAVGF